MDLRITATYAATDGRMPESVEVIAEGADLAGAAGLMEQALDKLLMAADIQRSAQLARDAAGIAYMPGERLAGDLGPGPIDDSAAMAAMADVYLDRICLRIGCGHVEAAHLPPASDRTNHCHLCPEAKPCPGLFATPPVKLTAATSAHGGEMLASDPAGHVRQAVDPRAAIMMGRASIGIRTGDELRWLAPAASETYGTWIQGGGR